MFIWTITMINCLCFLQATLFCHNLLMSLPSNIQALQVPFPKYCPSGNKGLGGFEVLIIWVISATVVCLQSDSQTFHRHYSTSISGVLSLQSQSVITHLCGFHLSNSIDSINAMFVSSKITMYMSNGQFDPFWLGNFYSWPHPKTWICLLDAEECSLAFPSLAVITFAKCCCFSLFIPCAIPSDPLTTVSHFRNQALSL